MINIIREGAGGWGEKTSSATYACRNVTARKTNAEKTTRERDKLRT
jgi:hypothetical protein